MPDAIANLEHVGNCIHEFSLNALPWVDSSAIDSTGPSNPTFSENVNEWLKSTDENGSKYNQPIDIKKLIFFYTQLRPITQGRVYIPGEYFAESSKESSQVEPGTLSLDLDLKSTEQFQHAPENKQIESNSHLSTLATQDSVHQDNAQTSGSEREHSSRTSNIWEMIGTNISAKSIALTARSVASESVAMGEDCVFDSEAEKLAGCLSESAELVLRL